MASIETVFAPVIWKTPEHIQIAPDAAQSTYYKEREVNKAKAEANLAAMLESGWRLLHVDKVEDRHAIYYCYQFFNPGQEVSNG